MANEPNTAQVGGTHYMTQGVQHWDYVEGLGMGYLEGCATKYICRWGKKYEDYREDVAKVRSYVRKIRHLHSQGKRDNRCLYAYGKRNRPHTPEDLRDAYDLSQESTRLIALLTDWISDKQLDAAELILTQILERLENGQST